MGKRKRQNGIDNFIEWQDNQFNPGYWTGGRMPPFLLGKRPNRMGYSYLVMGILMLLISVSLLIAQSFFWAAIMFFIACVPIASGIALLRSPKKVKVGRKPSTKKIKKRRRH